jgi:hypothetical protein
VRYGADGTMNCPDGHVPPTRRSLADYLDEARKILEALPDPPDDADDIAARVSPDFERLRWFELPADCLTAPSAGRP